MRLVLAIVITLSAVSLAQDRPVLGDVEQKLLDAANASRTKERLVKLTADRTLSRIALSHAENMARQEKMDHVLDGKGVAKRTTEGGYDYRVVGENLARAPGDKDAPPPAPADIHEHWMKSEKHRANLLNPKFRHLGLAVVQSAKGTYYYCQVFATPLK